MQRVLHGDGPTAKAKGHSGGPSVLLAAVSAGTLISSAPALAAEGPTVSVIVTGGAVAGVSSDKGIAYKGIPYAAPPEGDLRWRSPQPVKTWSGTKTADRFGPPCAQGPTRGLRLISDQSREDCLYLNVWRPPAAAGDRLPVMVWIHGGAFANGMTSSPTYDGAQLAAQGVVVVTVGYRLGVFGFLAHPDLTAESQHRSSGNFGLEDQVAALRWVSKNIRAFGGDPSNVTLFGQSAGGASVIDLVSSPLTKGMIKQAIVQSGAARALSVPPLAEAERQGLAFAAGQPISALRKLDAASLKDIGPPQRNVRFGPVRDEYVIVADPVGSLSARRHPAVALLIGSNSREGLNTPTDAQLPSAIREAFGPNAGGALAIYGLNDGAPGGADPLLGTAAQQFATDTSFRCGAVEATQLSASSGAPTWQYQFEQSVPGREAQGAGHSFEVPYVFGTLSPTGFSAANYGADDHRLSDKLVRYWTNFAKRGDPNGAGLPAWPRYTTSTRSYVRLSSRLPHDVKADTDLRGPLCRLLPARPKE